MARNPRMIGIWSAVGAVLLGCAYMAAAGAPIRYLAINGTALLIGLVMLVIADQAMSEPRRWSRLLTIAAAPFWPPRCWASRSRGQRGG